MVKCWRRGGVGGGGGGVGWPDTFRVSLCVKAFAPENREIERLANRNQERS